MDIVLEQGEALYLPEHRHDPNRPLVVRTDTSVGTGEELLVITPGKKGIVALPYGSKFLSYEPSSSYATFELPDGSTVSTRPVEEVIEEGEDT